MTLLCLVLDPKPLDPVFNGFKGNMVLVTLLWVGLGCSSVYLTHAWFVGFISNGASITSLWAGLVRQTSN